MSLPRTPEVAEALTAACAKVGREEWCRDDVRPRLGADETSWPRCCGGAVRALQPDARERCAARARETRDSSGPLMRQPGGKGTQRGADLERARAAQRRAARAGVGGRPGTAGGAGNGEDAEGEGEGDDQTHRRER